MEGELLGSGGLWLPWTLSPLPSEQLPLEPWRLQSFRAASQRPNSWWMPPTIRLRGGRSGSGVRVGLERAGEAGIGSNQSHLTHHPAPGHHRGSAMLVQILPSIHLFTLPQQPTAWDGTLLGGSASLHQLSLLLFWAA